MDGKKLKKIIIWAFIGLFALAYVCSGGVEDEWHKCMRCGGSGKVRSDSGYNVTCPRCKGVGALYY